MGRGNFKMSHGLDVFLDYTSYKGLPWDLLAFLNSGPFLSLKGTLIETFQWSNRNDLFSINYDRNWWFKPSGEEIDCETLQEAKKYEQFYIVEYDSLPVSLELVYVESRAVCKLGLPSPRAFYYDYKNRIHFLKLIESLASFLKSETVICADDMGVVTDNLISLFDIYDKDLAIPLRDYKERLLELVGPPLKLQNDYEVEEVDFLKDYFAVDLNKEPLCANLKSTQN